MKINIKENTNFLINEQDINLISYLTKILTYPFFCFFYRIIITFFHPRIIKRKFYVSICAIFKDEAPYLKEWIEFHKIVGIDHFYLYNNNSSDNYMDILKPYLENNEVTLIEWPQQQAQLEAYSDCILKYKNETNWIGFIDIDEFINPIKTNSIKTLLQPFKNFPSVLLYWKIFGSSGLIDRDINSLVTEDFKNCWEKFHKLGKCFYNTAYSFNSNYARNGGFHHLLWANLGKIYFPPVNTSGYFSFSYKYKINRKKNLGYINHYITKSYNEYVKRTTKGDVFYKNNPKSLEHFLTHELECKNYDTSLFRFITILKNKIKG